MDFVTALNQDPRVVIVQRHKTESYGWVDIYLPSKDQYFHNCLDRYTFECAGLLGFKYDDRREAMKVPFSGCPSDHWVKDGIQKLTDKKVKFQVI